MAHTDPTSAGRGQRLVYGGHTIGIAAGHLTRALPNLETVAGWRSCDHVGPFFEEDVLSSEVTVEEVRRLAFGALVDLRLRTSARRADGLAEEPTVVLDWRLVGMMA